jgi:RimJ/RimL family protein N-acetyltransferase
VQEKQTFTTREGLEVTLRPTAPDDSCGLIETVRSTSEERSYVLMEVYGRNDEAQRRFISELDRKRNLLLAAVAGGAVVGCLAALQAEAGQRPEAAHVLNVGLHLKEGYRGHGIGSRMLAYAVDWAQEHGFKKLSADIFTSNQRSLHLFSKAGFSEECVRRKQVRIGREYIDEVCMAKLLD